MVQIFVTSFFHKNCDSVDGSDEETKLSQVMAVPTVRGPSWGAQGQSETSSALACRSEGVEDAEPSAEGGAHGEEDCKTTAGARNAQNRVKMLRLLSKVSLVCQRPCFICASASLPGWPCPPAKHARAEAPLCLLICECRTATGSTSARDMLQPNASVGSV